MDGRPWGQLVSLSYSPEDAQEVLDYIEWVWKINAMPDGPWLYEDRDDVALDLWASYAVEEEC